MCEGEPQGARQETRHAQPQPEQSCLIDQTHRVSPALHRAEHGGVPPDHERHRDPYCQQHDLSAKIVAKLDFFLVRECCVVHFVEPPRLKEKVPDLSNPHRHDPTKNCRKRWLKWYEQVRHDETTRAQQMQRLVHTASMVVAMIVPALRVEFGPERGRAFGIGTARRGRGSHEMIGVEERESQGHFNARGV